MDLLYLLALLIVCPLAFCEHDDDSTLDKSIEAHHVTKFLHDHRTVVSGVNYVNVPVSVRAKRQTNSEEESSEDYEDNDSGEEGGGDSGGDTENYGDDDEEDDGEIKRDTRDRDKNKKQHRKIITTTPPTSGTLHPDIDQAKSNVTTTTQKPITAEHSLTTMRLTNGKVISDNWDNIVEKHVIRDNQPPRLTRPLTKLAVIAGKVFRHIIDEDTFLDPEEGVDLIRSIYHANNTELNENSWVQFYAKDREVYGLPLQLHVGQWNFIVEAKDSQGRTATSLLEIIVQQSKEARNHIFIFELKLNEPFPHAIDWQIRTLEGIVNLLRNIYLEQLTVFRAIKKKETCEFVWTYDTISDEIICPMQEITKLLQIMADNFGAPTTELQNALLPELEVVKVQWTRLGVCATLASETATVPTPLSFPPEIVNRLELLTAFEGHLMVQKIPEDTFVDPEDGNTRNLALSLRYSDSSELPHGYWLQLDDETQEMYGLPGAADVGSATYMLIAEDSSKKIAYENLVVEVIKSPQINPTAEFRMTLNASFLDIAFNSQNKRRLIEQIALLFGHKDTSIIRIASIIEVPATTVIWYNTTLQTETCPRRELQKLHEYVNGDGSDESNTHFRNLVDKFFDKDINVTFLQIVPLGLCLEDVKDHMNEAYAEAIDPDHSVSRRESFGADRRVYLYYDNPAGIDTIVTFVLPGLMLLVLLVFLAAILAVLLKKTRLRHPRVRVI